MRTDKHWILRVAAAAGASLGLGAHPPLPAAAAHAINTNTCAGEWQQVDALPRSAFADRLARWQAVAPKCANSGLYEVRLAALQTLVGRYDDARATVRSGLALDTPYKKELLSAMAAVALNQGQLADARAQYQNLISSYPDYFDGYCGTGAVLLIERKFPEAVQYLNQAAQRAQNAIIYRHLAIADHQLGQDRQAVDAFDKAYRLNPGVVGDKGAMDAVTRALINLGNYRAADGSMKLLLQADPAAGRDAEIQQTQRIIQEKLQQAGTAAGR